MLDEVWTIFFRSQAGFLFSAGPLSEDFFQASLFSFLLRNLKSLFRAGRVFLEAFTLSSLFLYFQGFCFLIVRFHGTNPRPPPFSLLFFSPIVCKERGTCRFHYPPALLSSSIVKTLPRAIGTLGRFPNIPFLPVCSDVIFFFSTVSFLTNGVWATFRPSLHISTGLQGLPG